MQCLVCGNTMVPERSSGAARRRLRCAMFGCVRLHLESNQARYFIGGQELLVPATHLPNSSTTRECRLRVAVAVLEQRQRLRIIHPTFTILRDSRTQLTQPPHSWSLGV